MPPKSSERRQEPRIAGESEKQSRAGGLRGERLSVASSDGAESDGPKPRARGLSADRREPSARDSSAAEGNPSGARKERSLRVAAIRPRDDEAEERRRDSSRSRQEKQPKDKRPREKRGSGSGGRRGLLGGFIRWSLTAAIWGLVALGVVVAYYAYDLPDVSSVAALTRRPSVTLVGADGQTFASFGDLYYDVVPLKEMPPYLPQAVIATEDRRFYDHFGIDPLGILRAAFENLRSGHIRQGASTITQQLAKNLFLTSERTFKRKAQEVLLALYLEHKFTKDEILTIYLNRVYLGSGTYGVEAAARKYFGKSARQVSLYEAAVLAGLLKAPSKFNPAANPELTAQRTAQVLQNMVDAGFLTPDKVASAAASRPELHQVALAAGRGRYFADWVMDQVRDVLGYVDRDIIVTTTFDPRLQQAAEESITTALDKDGAKLDIAQGALVAMTPDGAVKALVGGRDYRQSQFDRAVQALRQPGSSFKPFVYLAGLEAGYSPDSIFDDAPISIGKYRPNNYEHKFYGRVPLRDALAHSLNSVTVQLADKVGVKHVIDVAHRLGITSDLRDDLSIALGTSEVSLLELTAAYGSFANAGKGVWPYGVIAVKDRDGHLLYNRTGSGPGQVMTPREAAAMVEMMSGAISYGTGKAAAIGRPAAGKTGTTQDYRDAWFVGYTPDLVAGVWLGNDDDTPMKKVTGGRVPARIWHSFMLAALKDTPPHDFAKPPSMIEDVLNSLLGGGSSAKGTATRTLQTPPPGAHNAGDDVTLPGGLTKITR